MANWNSYMLKPWRYLTYKASIQNNRMKEKLSDGSSYWNQNPSKEKNKGSTPRNMIELNMVYDKI